MKFLLIVLAMFASLSVLAQVNFSNETEVSILQTGGNSNVETYNANTMSEWKALKRTYYFGGHYTLGTSEQVNEDTQEEKVVESARNWDISAKMDQNLSKRTDAFAGVSYEGDEFSGFTQRENVDLGLKYRIFMTEKLKSSFEVGLRHTVERRVEENEDGEDVLDFMKGRLYYIISHKKDESLSYKLWIEYLPNFTRGKDYMITYEPSITYVLSNIFSLKTSYRSIYDNVPNKEGNENRDYTLMTSLIAKF